ncbi:Actin-related protein 2/3 complex subunit 5 [Trichoplax sp. H2]|uniref:Actin-related protein 2/3 complex subunit 5 n=1 Tax=Trichoplax adhaerens TaxID=10228 RepID=B3RPC6_TRIAD|nr:hypothetical protein TRIADDRAFT_53486 [Trichoplax adhaerens]EDV27613.1 hypothetical protein TRIADDRAFT_53486 [Trichoplax adhaerens]RDD45371.1 Actin-related protein 2/3 complex subunit 5 [Trichoplax sp. H2]|eukprot:XP_002109447.1 hypothetical protein TRIADDRAFT_53486 [Trichoplax adhaerens]
MSKNTLSAQFRRVDVDALDENNFNDADADSSTPVGPDISAATRNKAEALKTVLQNPPLANSKDVKDQVFTAVLKVLTSHRSSDIEKSIQGLSQQEIDTLVKYIYRGFAEAKDSSCATLLAWHEKATAAGGLGSIVRVLTSLKTV